MTIIADIKPGQWLRVRDVLWLRVNNFTGFNVVRPDTGDGAQIRPGEECKVVTVNVDEG